MKNTSRIYESLIILIFIFLFFALFFFRAASHPNSPLLNEGINTDQIDHPELPIGPVEGICQHCRFIPANPIIFLELLQNAYPASTDHWFRKEFNVDNNTVMV